MLIIPSFQSCLRLRIRPKSKEVSASKQDSLKEKWTVEMSHLLEIYQAYSDSHVGTWWCLLLLSFAHPPCFMLPYSDFHSENCSTFSEGFKVV